MNKQRARWLWRCVTTRRKAHSTHRYAMNLWSWRKREPQVWKIRFARIDPYWQQWAKRVSWCESTGNAHASNGTHFSFFQWLLSTWRSAGGTGHPYDATWEHQAVLAVNWAKNVGQSQWTCS